MLPGVLPFLFLGVVHGIISSNFTTFPVDPAILNPLLPNETWANDMIMILNGSYFAVAMNGNPEEASENSTIAVLDPNTLALVDVADLTHCSDSDLQLTSEKSFIVMCICLTVHWPNCASYFYDFAVSPTGSLTITRKLPIPHNETFGYFHGGTFIPSRRQVLLTGGGHTGPYGYVFDYDSFSFIGQPVHLQMPSEIQHGIVGIGRSSAPVSGEYVVATWFQHGPCVFAKYVLPSWNLTAQFPVDAPFPGPFFTTGDLGFYLLEVENGTQVVNFDAGKWMNGSYSFQPNVIGAGPPATVAQWGNCVYIMSTLPQLFERKYNMALEQHRLAADLDTPMELVTQLYLVSLSQFGVIANDEYAIGTATFSWPKRVVDFYRWNVTC